MDNFDQLKQLWQEGAQSQVFKSTEEIVSLARKQQQKLLRSNLSNSLVMILTFAWIGFIFYWFRFYTAPLLLAFSLIALALLGWMSLSFWGAWLLRANDTLFASPQEYLTKLIRYRRFLQVSQQWAFPIYAVLLSLGLLLYYWSLMADQWLWFVGISLLTFAWLAYSVLVLGKKVKAKQAARLAALEQTLRQLSE
jgi:hypothetical protein